jgi:hypothetical protein
MGWPPETNVAEMFQKVESAAIYGVLKKALQFLLIRICSLRDKSVSDRASPHWPAGHSSSIFVNDHL